MIIKFVDFLKEVKIEDNVIIKGNLNIFKKYQDREFNIDQELLTHVVLTNINFDNKIIKINWNHTSNHSILTRIKTRTHLKTISEFNELFDNIINELFNNHFNELNTDYDKYNLFLINNNFSIIVIIDYYNLFDINTEIYVKTIINGFENNVDEIIEINDEY